MRSKSIFLIILGLSLLILGCDEEKKSTDKCKNVACQDNATCDPDTGACICDAGFDLVDTECLNERLVDCLDVAPDNAASTVVEVPVTYTQEDGWEEPAECAWECNDGYFEVEGECHQSQMVDCRDEPPANASTTDDSVQVPVVWDEETQSWTEPALCPWECNADFDEVDGACINQQVVSCLDVAPDNATSEVVDVTIHYTTAAGWEEVPECVWECNVDYEGFDDGCINEKLVPCTDVAPDNATSAVVDVVVNYTTAAGWEDAPECVWECNLDFAEADGACINEQTVPCTDVAPTNAYSMPGNVTIYYTTADGWETPAECAWNCNDGFHLEGDVCVESVEINWCNLQWPTQVNGYIERQIDFYGQVFVVDGTGQADRLPGITAKLCFALDGLPGSYVIDDLVCVDATYNTAVGNNDEYKVEHAFELPGYYEYVFAFSGDGGVSWTFCETTENLPGNASILSPVNGDFEDWLDVEGMWFPEAWTWGTALAVVREEANVHTGTYAVHMTRTVASNAQTEFTSGLNPVIEGVEYEISWWFFDNDPNGRGRVLYQWFDIDGNSMGGAVYGGYTSDSADWQQITMTGTAPATAAFVRVATRMYSQSGGIDPGGMVILDNITVIPTP